MVANVNPIYSRTPDIQWITGITAANNTADITSGTSYLVFTADATEGGFVGFLTLKANPANGTAATVLRIWVNNGGVTTTAANSALFRELTLPATSASATNANPDFVVPLNIALPPGYKIYVTLGTAAGGSGAFTAIVIGGKY